MKDRVINNVFKHPILGMLKVVECPDGECEGCVFYSRAGICCNDGDRFHTGQCSKERRIDKTDVIFIKAKGGMV